MSSLVDKIVALGAALDDADVPHAFGGALALAFHAGEPRATRDVDLNVFVPGADAAAVLPVLPVGVRWSAADVDEVVATGQVRLLWDDTPIDLFFSTHRLHEQAALGCVTVPFAGIELTVLGATELTVFKAFFDRTRDWADIEAMLGAGTVDVHAALGWLVDLLGGDDHRVARLRDLAGRTPSASASASDPRFAP